MEAFEQHTMLVGSQLENRAQHRAISIVLVMVDAGSR